MLLGATTAEGLIGEKLTLMVPNIDVLLLAGVGFFRGGDDDTAHTFLSNLRLQPDETDDLVLVLSLRGVASDESGPML